MHKRISGNFYRLGRAFGGNHAIGEKINVIDNLQRLLRVIRHHDRRHAQRVVQFANQVAHHVARNRVQPGEWFIVHNERRVQRDGARQSDAPHHAAGQLGRHQPCRAAQAHGVEFKQHQILNHGFGQIGFFAHRKRQIVEHRQIGEQTVLLKLHADLAAQLIQFIIADRVYVLPHHLAGAPRRMQLPADQAQQRRFAAAAAAHDARHLPARYRQTDILEDLTRRIGERQITDFDDFFRGHN